MRASSCGLSLAFTGKFFSYINITQMCILFVFWEATNDNIIEYLRT